MENVDDARGLGGRFRAWSGVGPVGFWDPMTITAWERTDDGGGRCEVLHRGAVVKGEGEFAVVARGEGASTLRVGRVVVVPLGAVGAAGLARRTPGRGAADRPGAGRHARPGGARRARRAGGAEPAERAGTAPGSGMLAP